MGMIELYHSFSGHFSPFSYDIVTFDTGMLLFRCILRVG